MHLLDLPNEILLQIYSAGGLDILASGLPLSCRRLYNLSFDDQLWQGSLTEWFHECYFSAERVSVLGVIPGYRKWFYQQLKVNSYVVRALDTLVYEAPTEVEPIVHQVISCRLPALVQLEASIQQPKTLAHFHWASWLKEIVCRMEGVYRLLELSTENDCGNGTVKEPIKHIEALLFLRLGIRPYEFQNALYADWSQIVAQHHTLSDQTVAVMDELKKISSKLGVKTDFFATLLKCTLFCSIAYDIWDDIEATLFTFPGVTYVCLRRNQDWMFIDFQAAPQSPRIRTLQEVRDLMAYAQVSDADVQLGVSFRDLMATTYVWHTLPSENRRGILGLIEHAALEVPVRRLQMHPGLYEAIAKRVILKNIDEIHLTPQMPLSRRPTGLLYRPGMVCQIVGMGRPEAVVVLESSSDSCMVLRGSQVRTVLSSMLVPGYDGKVRRDRGLILPDIDADMTVLGEYFLDYDPRQQAFNPA